MERLIEKEKRTLYLVTIAREYDSAVADISAQGREACLTRSKQGLNPAGGPLQIYLKRLAARQVEDANPR